MHDPMTVIRTLTIGPYPAVTLWHVDPETDGTDDSCGWFYPKLTDQDLAAIEKMVEWDLMQPFYTSQAVVNTAIVENLPYTYLQQPLGDCLGYVASAWLDLAWRLDQRTRLTAGEWWAVVNLAGVNSADSLRAILPDVEEEPAERVRQFLRCVLRQYRRFHRPWWRHPRWHVRHWSIQIHFLDTLKRWLFTRCAGCGKRFPWGYAPISGWGEDKGPRWFRGEKECYHHHCYERRAMKIRD